MHYLKFWIEQSAHRIRKVKNLAAQVRLVFFVDNGNKAHIHLTIPSELEIMLAKSISPREILVNRINIPNKSKPKNIQAFSDNIFYLLNNIIINKDLMVTVKTAVNSQKRLEKFVEIIADDKIDCYICKLDSNIKYLTGSLKVAHEGSSLIVYSKHDAFLFVPRMEESRVRNETKRVRIEVLNADKAGSEVFERIRELNCRRISFDSLSYVDYMAAKKKLPNVKIDWRPDILYRLRRVKDENEIKLIATAAKISDIGMAAASQSLRAGVREYELAGEIEYAMRKAGAEGFAFETNISSGFRSSYPHGGCTNKRISNGDIVVIDIGSQFMGYRSDLTRTYILGKPSTKQLKIYRAVYEAQEKSLEAIQTGMNGHRADSIARDIIRNKGYAEYFIHGLGHGVGLDVHEPPKLSPNSKDIIERGNVITVEPGIYLPNRFGVRIEDLTLAASKGLKLLSHAEKDIY